MNSQRLEELADVVQATEHTMGVSDTVIQRIMDLYNLPEHAQQVVIGAIEARAEAAEYQSIALKEFEALVNAYMTKAFSAFL